MDEKQKLNIIENLIENRFDKDNFSEFISNVLNVTVRNGKVSTAVWTEYKKYIESYQVFGDYKDLNSQKVYIIAVKVKDNVDPTRAKVKQREIVAKMLREYRKDAALVAFYSDRDPHWRMAFVKLEYSFTAKGLEEKLTPAKRLSYVIGEGEASHTVKKQFMTLIKLNIEVTLDNLEELFQLEKVTNEFFDEYKKKYLDLKEYLESNEEFMKEARKQNFENPENFSEGFAKKLMGQLAFLYFLQKKGWLGVIIVPKELSFDEYNSVLDRALSEEKDLLINTYNQKGNMFRLSSEVMNYSIQDSDRLANCFKNLSKFDGVWGSGDKKFIRKLFQRHLEIKENTGKEKTFFDDYLEELFYEALNLDRGSNQYFKKFNCKIPFLNGGLFEPYDNYDWKNTDFEIPDTLFSNENNDGILDIFDRYNFTISENEPYETEVAVDPEMLGKVFENLLDVSDRKSKGAFYTPREIVHYMCKESLINYLLNEIEEINREEVEYLIQLGEFTREYDEHLFEKDYMDYLKGITSEFNNSWGMPENIRKNAQKIDSIIKDVRVADPAIGSGAFPLGMLNEIVKVRNILTQYILFEEALKNEKLDIDIYKTLRNRIYNNRSLYRLKIETIENSLYGVDIEPSAVDIAKLRLWLSIVVDTRDNDIRPLPNLDFNFMVGNSLIDEFDGVQLFDEKLLTKRLKETYTDTTNTNKLFNVPTGYQKDLFGGTESLKAHIMLELDKQHKEFFKERNTEKKKEIKNKIEDSEWILITQTLTASGNQAKIKELEKLKQQKRKPYFLWKLEFAKVFQEKGGFDIIIGNPPYVGDKGNKNIFRPIKNTLFGEKYYKGQMDLFYFFFHLGITILKNNGILSYITTNYFLTASGGIKLRKHLKDECSLLKLINFNELKVFETALGQHNIITSLQKERNTDRLCEVIIANSKGFVSQNKLINILNKRDDEIECYEFNQKLIYEGENLYIRLQGLGDNDLSKILQKMENNNFKLKDVTEINAGIGITVAKATKKYIENFPYLNLKVNQGIFVINEVESKDIEKEKVKNFVKNSNISHYAYELNKDKLIYLTRNDNIEEFPKLKNHMLKFKDILDDQIIKYEEEFPWFALNRPRTQDIFESLEKIIVPYRSKKNYFAYSNEPLYGGRDVLFIRLKPDVNFNLKYILALLNSKLYYFWLYNKGKRKGEILELVAQPLSEIPIKFINQEKQIKFVKLIDKIFININEKQDISNIQNELDELIYDLYELTEVEKEIIRKF